MTKKELIEIAQEYYISGYSGKNKNALIRHIKNYMKKRLTSYQGDLKHFKKKLKLDEETLKRYDKNISELGLMELEYIEQERERYGLSRSKMRDMLMRSLKKDIKHSKKAIKNLTKSIDVFSDFIK